MRELTASEVTQSLNHLEVILTGCEKHPIGYTIDGVDVADFMIKQWDTLLEVWDKVPHTEEELHSRCYALHNRFNESVGLKIDDVIHNHFDVVADAKKEGE